MAFGDKVWAFYTQVSRPILDVFHTIFNSSFYFLLFIGVFLSLLYLMMLFIVHFSPLKRRVYAFDRAHAPFVSVQIPTFNELAAIKCAQRCLEFDYPQEKFEIIIGDDSNDPAISSKISSFAEGKPQIKVVRRGNNIGYKAGNLNHMLGHSKGEILVLFDSDFLPEKNFLKEIAAPFQHDKKIAAVQARWKFTNAHQNMISVLGASIVAVFHHITLPFISRGNIAFLCGSAEAVRKDKLIALGGWKSGSLTEDIEYSLRLLKSGDRIVYLDTLECEGEVPHQPMDLYRQQMRWAYGVISSFRQHGRDILAHTNISARDKFYITFMCTGYLLSAVLLGLFMTGFLSFVTHAPGPIDFGKFFWELGRNILLTSGLLVVTAAALAKSRNAKGIGKMIGSSFSYGLIMTYYVNVGIYKVFLNKPMEWYMLKKQGNLLES